MHTAWLINEAMAHAQLTQAALCEEIGCAPAQMAKWRKQSSAPSDRFSLRLAELARVPRSTVLVNMRIIDARAYQRDVRIVKAWQEVLAKLPPLPKASRIKPPALVKGRPPAPR